MINILLLSRYGNQGASSRVRSYQYIPYLEGKGVSLTVSPLFNNSYLRCLYAHEKKPLVEVFFSYLRRLVQLVNSRKYDLIWLEKELFPFFPAWGEIFLKALATPYVVDFDDAIFHGYDQHRSPIIRYMLGNKIDRIMRNAALVIAGNDYLAKRAHQAGARQVEILASVVDVDRYQQRQSSPESMFTIGWIGSPSTARIHLKLVEAAISKFCMYGKSRLTLIGSGTVEFAGVPIDIRPWREENEVADIQSFSVGIMPLPDSPWERGKCGYKLIQCMACGLPVIASPVGVNQQIIDHGINGFLASTTDEWLHSLTILRDNPEMRARMGKAAREKVMNEFSLQLNAPRLLGIFKKVVAEYQ